VQKRLCSMLVVMMMLVSIGSAFNSKVYASSSEEPTIASLTSAATQVWTSDSLTKVFQSTLFDPNASQNLNIISAKNEYRSGQIVIRSDHQLSNIQMTPSNLVGPNQFILSDVTINLIDYLKIRRHSPDLDPNEVLYPPDSSSMLYPDALLPTSHLAALPANTTQPFWYKAFIPSDAPAGDYYGTVQIHSDQEQYTVNVHLRVYGVTVPTLANTNYKVDNWLVSAGWAPHGVAAIDYQYGIDQWSNEWWTLMERLAAYMAEHRNNVLWVSPMAFLQTDSSIDAQGNIVFDWTNFDRFVQLFKSKGSGHYLHGVSLFLGKNTDDRFLLSILDNVNGTITQKNVTKDDPKAEAWLVKYLPALAAHLQEKGWLDTFIQSGGDEPRSSQDNTDNNWLYEKIHTLGTVQDATGATHGMKTADAQVIKQEQSKDKLDVFIVKQDVFDLNPSFHQDMQRLGKDLWLYICNYPQGKYLNRLHDMHLTKTLLPHWYTFMNGMQGYLHYGFNIWAPEPMSIGRQVEVSSQTGLDYWAPSKAVDGVVSADLTNLGWSSKANVTPNAEEYLTINFGEARKVRKVALLPRIDGDNFGYGFPVNFTIETFDSTTSSWITQVTETNFPKPERATYLGTDTTFNLSGILTQYVRVKASKLGCGDHTCADYRLQFSEVEVIGDDDVFRESDYGSPGDAWLVYPDKENLDVMSSMRSEVQLEGIQDYELLSLLEDAGKGEVAHTIAKSIISSGTKYNKQSDAIIAARKAILDLLTDQYTVETFVDPLNDMNSIFAHSPQVGFDTSNSSNTAGDTSRLARTTNTDQFIVYSRPNIRSFNIQFYSDSTDYIEILGSSDNNSWTPLALQKSQHTNMQNGWFGFTVSSNQVPQGMNYLKIVIKGSNTNSWTPQIGEVTLTYGFDVNKKESLITNSGFEVGLWPDHTGAELDVGVKFTGHYSAKLTSTGLGAYIQSANAIINTSKKHSFSIRLKTDQISSQSGVKVEFMQVDANGQDTGIYSKSNGSIQTGGTRNWTEFKIDSIDTAAAGLRVIVRIEANITGTVWVDDVVLQDSDFVQTYVDSFNDMNGIYAHSTQLGLDNSNPNTTGGDTSRIARFENTDQYFIYNKPNITEFEAKVYSDTTTNLAFYASSDNQTWTAVSMMEKNQAPTDWGWFTTTKVASNIPIGTHYMKVVILGTNTNSWSPQIGEIKIKYGYEVLTLDTLENDEKIFERSPGLSIDSSNPAIAGGDTSRIARTENTDQYLIYRRFDMNGFIAKFYSQSASMRIDIYTSPNNGTWTKLESIGEAKNSTSNGWYNINLSSNTLPVGTNYLRIVFRHDNEASWSPQLGEISFT